ncbi:MAG: hypothetical protein J5792_07435 [Bacteroidales bacterium]|nr:hypothetical protein [Bacteroidales bacterium]
MRNELENTRIRQSKTIDTLKVELQKKTLEIEALGKDTALKALLLNRSKTELQNIQNLLTSSKKELNERMQDLQVRDRYIHQIQQLYQHQKDSLEAYLKEMVHLLDSLQQTDSTYKEVTIVMQTDQLTVCMPEHFFFTGNNRNFISAKGKNMTQMLAAVLQQHPSAQTELILFIPPVASPTAMKESADRASVRISSIYRAICHEFSIESSRLQAGIASDEAYAEHVCFRFTADAKPILETIKNL